MAEWNLHGGVLLVIGLLAGAYAVGVRGEVVSRRRLACFGAGLALLLVAHVSPIGTLATERLLTAHLLQNVIMAEWAPALLVLGIPAGLAAHLGRLPGARALTHPAVALLLWAGAYGAWHVPAAYDAALERQATLLNLEHATYVLAGVLLWWPVFQSSPRALSSGAKAIYLLAAFMLASPLGLVLSLLPSPAYDFYVAAPDAWGLSDLADQQIAGVTMSVEESLLFFGVGAYYLARYLYEEQARNDGRPGSSQIA